MVVAGCGVARADMTIRDYDAARHDRFYTGSDKSFLGEAFDWSGVGKAKGRWVTMISPSYFLSAEHYEPADNEEVVFYEGNDTSAAHVYTIDSGVQIDAGVTGTDLWLGKLTTPLDAAHNISFYPILTLANDSAYVGMEIYNYGKSNRVGRNVIERFEVHSEGGSTGNSMIFDFDDNDAIDVGGDETYLELGDSGAPSFAVWDGELALVGIHWYNNSSASPKFSGDTFVPTYFNEIGASMSGESLTAVPEPSTLVLWSMLGILGLAMINVGLLKRTGRAEDSSIH
jgi:hypothetical protein